MNKITVKLDEEMVRTILAGLEEEIISLEEELNEKREQRDEMRRALNKTESVEASPLSVSKGASGRARKGESAKVIASFLAAHGGERFTQAQISEATGVSMTSSFRALKQLVDNGTIKNIGNLYHA